MSTDSMTIAYIVEQMFSFDMRVGALELIAP